jgi:hypothetical protein
VSDAAVCKSKLDIFDNDEELDGIFFILKVVSVVSAPFENYVAILLVYA